MMSEREQVIEMINGMPEYKIAGLLAFLRTFEDIPNQLLRRWRKPMR